MRGAALAVPVAAALALLAGCGGDGEPAEATRGSVREAVEARLLARKLSFEWVYCLRTGRSFQGSPIFRCNVNFGEPRIVVYCATLEGGELVTTLEEPRIRCGRGVS